MKYLFFTILVMSHSHCYSQDPDLGTKRFDLLYAEIKRECGSEEGYRHIKFKKKKVNEDLFAVTLVNNVNLDKISIDEAYAVLKRKGVNVYIQPYTKEGYNGKWLTINGIYIEFEVITLTKSGTQTTHTGATLKSTYKIHCISNPNLPIATVDIDPDFFKKHVVRRLSCPYVVYNELQLGGAGHMANELNVHF